MTWLELLTVDLTKEQMKIIRSVAWRVIVGVFILFSFDLFGAIGFRGFARADEIDRKVLPISQALDRLSQTVAAQGQVAKEQSLQILSNQMIDVQAKRCVSHNHSSSLAYTQLLTQLEQRYYNLAQQTYPLPLCADL